MASTTASERKSLKDRLLSAPRGVPQKVDMSRFPDMPQDELYVRPPTGAALTAWEQAGVSFDDRGKVKVKQTPTRKAALIRICLCDQNGELVFSQADEQAIANLDAPVVNHLYEQALRVSGQRRDEEDEDDADTEGN